MAFPVTTPALCVTRASIIICLIHDGAAIVPCCLRPATAWPLCACHGGYPRSEEGIGFPMAAQVGLSRETGLSTELWIK